VTIKIVVIMGVGKVVDPVRITKCVKTINVQLKGANQTVTIKIVVIMGVEKVVDPVRITKCVKSTNVLKL